MQRKCADLIGASLNVNKAIRDIVKAERLDNNSNVITSQRACPPEATRLKTHYGYTNLSCRRF